MAKGSISGLVTGKLGQNVWYRVANSNDKQTQGIREYRARVANPQTESQSAQRMKLAPAANFYRGLAEILDHSWQGVKYGNKSRQYFMAMAMSNANSIVFPFVLKGEKRFVPGEYPIARGSIAPLFVTSINASTGATTSIASGGDMDVVSPFSEVVNTLLQANPTLQAGDQLTFIACYEHEGSYYPVYRRLILDTAINGESEASQFQTICHKAGIELSSLDDVVTFNLGSLRGTDADAEFYPIVDNMVAAAIVVSRHYGEGNETGNWLRSAADLYCSDAFLAQWMSAEQYAAAVESYTKTTSSASSDKYLNQSDTPNVGSSALYNTQVAPSTLFTNPYITISTRNVAILYNAEDNKSYYIIEADGDGFVGYALNSQGSYVQAYIMPGRSGSNEPKYDYKSREEADAILGRTNSGGNRYPAPAPLVPSDSDFIGIVTVDLPSTVTGTAGKVSAVLAKDGDTGYTLEIPINNVAPAGSVYPKVCLEADGFDFVASPVTLVDEEAYNAIVPILTAKAKEAMDNADPSDVETLEWQDAKNSWPFLSFTF